MFRAWLWRTGLWFDVYRLGDAVKPPAADLAEPFDQFAGVLGGQVAGGVAQGAETAFEAFAREGVVAVLFGGGAEQFPARVLQDCIHLGVSCEVQFAEVVDEPGQAVEGALVYTGFALADAREHLVAQAGGLFPERGHGIGDEVVDALADLGVRAMGGPLTGLCDRGLVGGGDEFDAQVLGHGDLEVVRLEAVFSLQLSEVRKRGGHVGDQHIGIDCKTPGGFRPLADGGSAQHRVLGEEGVKFGEELGLQACELFVDIGQLRVGEEAGDTVEEGEARGFDQRVGAAFEQGEALEAVLGQQLLVAEADEPVAELGGIQTEVFGAEFLGRPPVADGGMDEHAGARQRVQQLGWCVVLGHGIPWVSEVRRLGHGLELHRPAERLELRGGHPAADPSMRGTGF